MNDPDSKLQKVLTVDQLQTAALDSQAAVPYLYGQDDVHGVNYCLA